MEPTRATKLTVYIGDSDKHGRKPLHPAIVELLHEEGILGATVVHGIEGYGAQTDTYVEDPGSLRGPACSNHGGGSSGEDRGRALQARRDDRRGPRDYRRGADRHLPPSLQP
jgi:hypothetical protein